MQFELVMAFTLIFLVDSISPGPASAAVVAKGATTGLRRTLPFICGLVLGDLVLFALAVAGLAALAAAMGPFFAVIKWVGIAYLLYLAYKMWTAKPVKMCTAAPQGEGLKLFGLGILLPLGNPKAIGFYIALLPAVMNVSAITLVAAFQLSLIIIGVWALVLIAYAAAADRASRMISTPRAQLWLNRSSAGAMIGAAGTIAAR
ncbi:LysE family translocator [uncultured Tateyamaria sp.]|uniref:LysE family translocator n=1 Tax=uncultured Tateyamaria sp. TaxID=455651 RepID=UPI0026299BDE|nr:LysE family translocator [uncultured Tateyamaria sp.]